MYTQETVMQCEMLSKALQKSIMWPELQERETIIGDEHKMTMYNNYETMSE